MDQSRIQYFIAHLVISAVVVGGLLLLILSYWYPTPLANATGIYQIILILACVDVIIGPILSFIVYNRAKKTLKFDLLCVVFIQLMATTYGFYSIAQARPAWLVFTIDRFELVRKNEIAKADQNVLPEFRFAPWSGPKFIGAQRAGNLAEAQMNEFMSGLSLSQMPESYVPIEQVYTEIKKKVYTYQDLLKYNSAYEVNELKMKYPHFNAWLPLQANAEDKVVLFNKDSITEFKIIDLRPWN